MHRGTLYLAIVLSQQWTTRRTLRLEGADVKTCGVVLCCVVLSIFELNYNLLSASIVSSIFNGGHPQTALIFLSYWACIVGA